jgi:hypothetical protein
MVNKRLVGNAFGRISIEKYGFIYLCIYLFVPLLSVVVTYFLYLNLK